jgi:hypothetical protein
MQQAPRLAAAFACGIAVLSSACESSTAPDPLFANIEVDHVAQCGSSNSFSLPSGEEDANPYFPIAPEGREWVLTGEEKGDLIELTITVLGETEVAGVMTRIVREVEVVNGFTVEESLNYFAHNEQGTVCYFGEDVDIHDPNGGPPSHDGAWRAGQIGPDGFTVFVPGIIMPADPRVGMRFKMEGAPGVAEDEGRITGSGQVKVAAGTFNATLRVREFNPLDGGSDFKIYAQGVGLLIDAAVELQSCTVNCPAGN